MTKTSKKKEVKAMDEIEKTETNKKVNPAAASKKTEAKPVEKPKAIKLAPAKSIKATKASSKAESNTEQQEKPKVARKETSKQRAKTVANLEPTVATQEKPKIAVKTEPKAVAKLKAVSNNGGIINPAVQAQVKTEIIVEPVQGAEPVLEVMPVLKEPLDTAPIYTLREVLEAKKQAIPFHKIIPNDDIIDALNKANYKDADENLQKLLQAVLRGSDIFSIGYNSNRAFLIGAVASAYKVLSGALTRGEAKQPLALVLVNDEKKLNELFTNTSRVFPKLGVNFTLLSESASDDEKKIIIEKHIDVLFSTVKTLEHAQQLLGLNLSSIGVCFAYGLDEIAHSNYQVFTSILNSLPQERVQKVFLTTDNTPKVRELVFSYLNDLEYFCFSPCYVKDRLPKQFAHALTVTQKFQVLLGHLKKHKPTCAVVFANTKSVAEWIAFKLHGNGIKVELMTSNFNFSKKQQLIKSIQSGDINVVVTTDYHSTSFGLADLNCVYQFDLPDTPEKFISRLNLIEKSKSPISVSFICEDYGYNMGKIEEKLGFKVHVVNPDKDYFNIKDVSEYPLEADGRVKRIGQVYSAPVAASAPSLASVPAPATPVFIAPPIERPFVDVQPAARLQPRPAASGPSETFIPKANFENRPLNKFNTNKPHDKYENKPQNKFDTKYQDKFIRRDDKAKEAIDSARMAAQEKRASSATQGHTDNANKNIFSVAVYIMQDALKAATQAAKQSLAANIEQNLPVFSTMLSKVPFLKKMKEK